MDKAEKKDFSRKVRIATAIVTVTILLILLVIYSVKVFLLVFAGVMMAVFFRAIASAITKRTGWSMKLTLPISIIGVLALWVLLFMLMQPKISSQIDTLSKQVPEAAGEVRQKLEGSKTGRFILEQIPFSLPAGKKEVGIEKQSDLSGERPAEDKPAPVADEGASGKPGAGADKQMLQDQRGKLQDFARRFFSSTLGILGDIYVIFLLGIFFTADPEPYIRGIVSLFPKRHRKRSREVIEATGITLKLWLFGKMLSMLVVAILTVIGLWILGIPMFFTLAIIAGLVSFIPNFGPLIAIVPAFLVGYVESPSMGLYVILLYMGIQAVESNLITPYIMKKQIQIPLAMTLFSQILLALLVGGLGLIFATPIVAMFMVIIQMVYIQDTLGDRSIDVKGERLAKQEKAEE